MARTAEQLPPVKEITGEVSLYMDKLQRKMNLENPTEDDIDLRDVYLKRVEKGVRQLRRHISGEDSDN
jgi:hypothetical protein